MISHPALAVISAAILAYEVLLVRLFAIVQWHHFAFMAISVALLGFGISGALLTVFKPWTERRQGILFSLAASFFAISAPVAFVLAQQLPFNALSVVWAPSQLLYLGVIYLLLAIPFTAGASCIGLAFLAGKIPGRIYLWNLLGSGAGALGVLALLFELAPMACLLVVALLAFLAGAINEASRRAWRGLAVVGVAAGLALFAWSLAPAPWVSLRISEFKGLSQALLVQDARMVAERSGPLALLSVIESPAVPFRFAPGLSLQSPALPPPQLGVFADGDFAEAVDTWDGRAESLAYLDQSTDALAYHLVRSPEVLVLGAGGGRGVLQALGHGAARIDAVERNAEMLRLVGEAFAAQAGELYTRPGVVPHVADARHFLTAAKLRWDLVLLPLIGDDPTGARGLTESYLYTAEAFATAYQRLREGGWLSLTSRVELPPRIVPKLIATLLAGLAAEGVADPGTRILAIRGISTVTLLIKRGEVSAEDTAAARAFAAARGFDLVYYPGIPEEEANRRNILAGPVYFEAVSALLGPEHRDFINRYKFDIAPATDDRPYFFDFFRWTALPELLALGPAGGAVLLELGELIVTATLVQALVLSLVLVLLPLRARRYRGKPREATWRYGAYFTALGLAFLFVEIAFIQKFVLFVGHPLYAVSVVLTGFLVFAGLGAETSARLERRLAGARMTAIDAAVAGIALTALGYLAALPSLFGHLAGLSDGARILLSLALVAPLAFFMGMPFPLGLARVARADPDFVPWAWGLNGCASVVSVTAATLLTMHLGFTVTVAIAVGLYVLAALALRMRAAGRQEEDAQERPQNC